MKLCRASSPMPPRAARGPAPRYEGYHRCKGKGDQVLTCTCHMCTTNELSACFWVNTLMIAMGGNFFLIRVVLYDDVITWFFFTIWSKISISLDFDESVTDGRTDGRTDRPVYRDARTPLKTETRWNMEYGSITRKRALSLRQEKRVFEQMLRTI